MAIALAGFVTAGALPAAATPGIVPYVALGDSYAAGQGAPPYVRGNSCLQSRDESYPVLLDSESIRINLTANAACSGATTDVVRSQLSALDRDTRLVTDARLVTLTVGAANLGLSAVLDACLPGPSQHCDDAIRNAQDRLGDCREGKSSELDRPLAVLYAEVAAAARGSRIVVTGYPLLFEVESPVPGDDKADINEATTDLNCVIERALAATQATYANIYYVDVTEEFAGHGIGCTPSPNCLFINAPAVPLSAEAFHPTAAGYAAYAEAIKTKLPNGWLDKQDRSV
jgi:lysophospholipase L1-like esterase